MKPLKTETATKIISSIILARMEFYCRESFNWIRWASQIKILDITVVSAQAFSLSESKLSHNDKITSLRFSHKLYLNRHRFRVFITNSPRNSKKMKFSTMFVACNISGTFGFREFHRQLLRSDSGWYDNVQANQPLADDSTNSQGLDHRMDRNERLKLLMGMMNPQTNGRIINRISDINPWNLYLYTN